MEGWDERVSPHFRWREFVTGTPDRVAARRAGLAGDPAAQLGIRQVAEVLEGLRLIVAEPIWITSGYRGPTRTGSQHDTGHAVDIQVRSLSPIDLMRILWGWHDRSPHRLFQVIGETTSTDRRRLEQRMEEESGQWVHVGLATGPWARASRTPWATSVAPPQGEKRAYPAWRPA